MIVTAVVLAGGGSSRFGADKLAADVSGRTLLETVVAALPSQLRVVVVGPPRPLPREVTFTREQPPGGGPAAALVAGLRVALEAGPDAVVVLPGDAPAAGLGAMVLLDALGGRAAVVGTDAAGQWQPLQLALAPAAARRLVDLAGPDGAAGRSARRLVVSLDPVPVVLPAPLAFDVDTMDELLLWRLHTGPAVTSVVEALATRSAPGRPLVVAIDGPSGAGKSTLAAALALRTDGVMIDGDDFYNPALSGLGPAECDKMGDAEVAAAVIDWRRLRAEVLEPLRAGAAATYRPYDWAAQDGRLVTEPRRLNPGDPVILEGVYSARPELADLVDLAVHLETDPGARAARLAERGDAADWAAFWERGERHYFTVVRPPAAFDLRVSPSQPGIFTRSDGKGRNQAPSRSIE